MIDMTPGGHSGRKPDGPSIINSLVRLINNDAAGAYWLMKFRQGQAAIRQQFECSLTG
jgi:hypothetical protein